MFNKKNLCTKCKKKIEDKYAFCPYCGHRMNAENEEDWGMLGKNDFINPAESVKLPMGLNSIFNALIKQLSKEMDSQLKNNLLNETKDPKNIKRGNLSISISTLGGGPPKIKVTQLPNSQKTHLEKEDRKFKQMQFSKEKIKEFTDLPREEPKTSVRRFSDKIVYEIEIPEVKSIEDVSIIKLENSIEIKAIGKEKAYTKIISINLPIQDYDLSDGKLILELGVKN